MDFSKAFAYKRWANQEILDFGERQESQLPGDDREFFVRILNHTAVVDALFISRLQGLPDPFSGDNTPETPSFAELRQRMASQDQWLCDYAAALNADQCQRQIAFRFTDGDTGRLSVEEILLHLLTHGSNHRGMASRTLASNGLERPKDTFTRYLHQSEPERRFEQ